MTLAQNWRRIMSRRSIQTLRTRGRSKMNFSQNARTALSVASLPLMPAELSLSSIAQDRIPLSEIIERAKKKGCVPFDHNRLGEIMVRYEQGLWSPPGPGWWVLVTTDWEKGFFTLEFRLPPPVPQRPVLELVNFTGGTDAPFSLKPQFLFNRK